MSFDFLASLVLAHGYLVVFCAIALDFAALPIPGELLLLTIGGLAVQGRRDRDRHVRVREMRACPLAARGRRRRAASTLRRARHDADARGPSARDRSGQPQGLSSFSALRPPLSPRQDSRATTDPPAPCPDRSRGSRGA